MCFSIPKQIKTITNKLAVMEDGVKVKLGDLKVAKGDYILTYGNMAIEKITKEQALQTRQLISTINTQE